MAAWVYWMFTASVVDATESVLSAPSRGCTCRTLLGRETKAVGRRSVLESCSRAGNGETKGVGLIVSRARSVVVWQ
jgi:hypothetical protein